MKVGKSDGLRAPGHAVEFMHPGTAALMDVLAEVVEQCTKRLAEHEGREHDDAQTAYKWRDAIVKHAEDLGEAHDEPLHNREHLIEIATLAIAAVQAIDRKQKAQL